MKKIPFVLLFMLCVSSVSAAPSGEFTFMWDLLDALRFCQSVIDCRIITKTPPQKMIADTEEANVNLEKARHFLELYAKDKDDPINKCAVALINGIDILMYSNDVLNGKLQSVAGLHPYGFRNTASETARFRAQSKRGWEEFFSSLSTGVPLVILKSPQDQNARRKAYKISKEERLQLKERINTLFPESDETYIEVGEEEVLRKEMMDLHRGFTAAVAAITELLTDEYD
jgi:hypothetical protein